MNSTGMWNGQERLRVNGPRLLGALERLRSIGATARGGVSRLAFTPEDVAGRQLAAQLMVQAGLSPRVDPAANLIGTRRGRLDGAPMLLVGSHLDTVIDGGAYDGAYGVVAAIEVAHTLHDHGMRLTHPIGAVAFTNEEGAFGTKAMWGSHALVGALNPDDLVATDSRGTPVTELLTTVGGNAARVGEAAWPPGSVAAYLELHVEQGPVLERLGVPIGVVEAFTGRVNVELLVEGASNHAGTTPMAYRRDALVAASHLVLAVRDLAAEEALVRVATTGTCTVSPGIWNVIPGMVRLGAELRDDDAAIDRALARLGQAASQIARTTDTIITIQPTHRTRQVACDPRLRALVAQSAEQLDLRHVSLPSGAGHDAQIIGQITPIGMIFVPSRGGVSHAPGEWTAPEHLVAGANVLLATLLASDQAC
jgi:hydantoinase/carbamoylase family amidase